MSEPENDTSMMGEDAMKLADHVKRGDGIAVNISDEPRARCPHCGVEEGALHSEHCLERFRLDPMRFGVGLDAEKARIRVLPPRADSKILVTCTLAELQAMVEAGTLTEKEMLGLLGVVR